MGLYTEIGRLVKTQRKNLNLTQQELADRCNLTKSDISRIENEIGNPSIERLDKIIDSLGVIVNEIKVIKTE